MVEFTFEGMEGTLTLPDEYLTAETWEKCLRFFKTEKLEDIDITDMGLLRRITTVISPQDSINLGQVLMTKANIRQFIKLYQHVGVLLANSMSFGDDVLEEEIKKDEAPSTQIKRKAKVSTGASK